MHRVTGRSATRAPAALAAIAVALVAGACSKGEPEAKPRPNAPISAPTASPRASGGDARVDETLKERLARQEAAAKMFERNVLIPQPPRSAEPKPPDAKPSEPRPAEPKPAEAPASGDSPAVPATAPMTVAPLPITAPGEAVKAGTMDGKSLSLLQMLEGREWEARIVLIVAAVTFAICWFWKAGFHTGYSAPSVICSV